MFDQLFGDSINSANAGTLPPSNNDDPTFLTDFAAKGSVIGTYRKLQKEFVDNIEATGRQMSIEACSLKKAGNEHFMVGRYCDAIEAYKQALALDPGHAELYANISLSLLRCGRYEEAVASAHAATVIEPTWPKGFVLLATAFCHLGYTDVATYYATACMAPFGMEVAAECERSISNSIAGKLDPSMYRTTDAHDLQMTLGRFLDTYVNIDQLIYLFVLLDFHMSCKDQNQMMHVGAQLRSSGLLRKFFRDVPLTSGTISNANNLLSLQPDDAHLLSACLRITGYASCGSPQACNELLNCQEFFYFLSSSSRQIVEGNFLKAILGNPGRYVFHRQIVDNLLRTVCTATSQGGPFNRFLRPVEPFRNFSWHIKLLAVWFSMFQPIKNSDIMCHLVVSVSKICEENPSILDELATLPRREAVGLFSLLSTISQIYVECCIHPSVESPIQLDLLLVFWLFLTKDSRAVAFCVQCPRVWTFLANRLHAVVNNINPSTLTGETWFLLEILCNMSAYLKKTQAPSLIENYFENGQWFGLIVEAISDVAWRKSKHHVVIRSALMLAARCASFSKKFCEAFVSKITAARLVRLASCGEPDVDAPALHCLGTILNRIASPELCKETTSSKHFPELATKIVNSIMYAVNPLSALAHDSKTCLLNLIDERNGEDLAKSTRSAFAEELKKVPQKAHFAKNLIVSDPGLASATGTAPTQQDRIKKMRERFDDPFKTNMLAEPLPENVTTEEAATLSTSLTAVLIKVEDEFATLCQLPQSESQQQ